MESDTFCIAAAADSHYQNTDRAVQTQHSWLHGFSSCMLVIFCDIKSGKRWLYYYYVCCILLMYTIVILVHFLLLFYHNTLELPCSPWKERHPPPAGTMSYQSAYTIILLMAVPLKKFNAGSGSVMIAMVKVVTQVCTHCTCS